MAKLDKMKNIVLQVLENNEDARKSDFILYSYVLDELGIAANFDLRVMLKNHKLFGLPPFASVARARRKIQAERPDLKDQKTAEIRNAEQEEYVEFARL